jgi:hypothetical protein
VRVNITTSVDHGMSQAICEGGRLVLVQHPWFVLPVLNMHQYAGGSPAVHLPLAVRATVTPGFKVPKVVQGS